MKQRQRIIRHITLFFVLIVLMSMAALIQGQEVTPEPEPVPNIEFSGEIASVDANLIVVNGLNVLTDDAEIEFTLDAGLTVHIEGVLQSDGTVLALVITSVDEEPEPEATEVPEVTPEPNEDEGDDSSAVIIVIEGPVQAININVITIYSIDIELDEDDPVLTVIQLGDVIHIEGEFEENDDDRVVIIPINIIFISVEVFINADGEIWRDPLTCVSAPPPWAEATAWFIRCETTSGPPSSTGGGRGGSGRGGS